MTHESFDLQEPSHGPLPIRCVFLQFYYLDLMEYNKQCEFLGTNLNVVEVEIFWEETLNNQGNETPFSHRIQFQFQFY